MLYYRYRPFSELSLKELMYDELFFASAEECNDPHECWDFLVFSADYEKWHRLLELAWKNVDEKVKAPFFDIVCNYLVEKSPITVCEILSRDFFLPLLENDIFRSPVGYRLLIGLIDYLNIYLNGKKYFISFSRNANNYLMWSHYANKHIGYCLIFKSIDDCLYQAKDGARTSIEIKSYHSNKVHITENIGPKFKFHDVIYGESKSSIDPFCYFPEYVNKCCIENDEERIDFFNQLERHYLEKGTCWEYEQESRLLLPSPNSCSWFTGCQYEYTKYQRLFHYDSSQLVGVVFGSRLEKNDKKRIKEIIDEKIDFRLVSESTNKRFFKFVYFQTKLSSKERKLELEPLEINSLSTHVKKTDAAFDREYEEWKKGWCLEFSGPGSARKTYVV